MRIMSPLLTVAMVSVSAEARVEKASAEHAPSKMVFNVISSSQKKFMSIRFALGHYSPAAEKSQATSCAAAHMEKSNY
jgi:hypothetical protein